jgi:AcrR family transcriptional regulator
MVAEQRRARKPKPRRPGRPRRDDGNQRERLLDAAVECFTADGIAATSLRNIAVKAGVTPALVNYYFGSKERLFDAFVAERVLPVSALLRAGIDAGGADARTVVAEFVRSVHAAVARFPWVPSLWVREILSEHGALRPVLLEQISPQVPRVLAQALAEAQKRGALNADLDPRLLVVSLIGLTLFPLAAEPIWRRVFDAGDIDHDALLQHTLALLDRGLGALDER